MTPEDTEKKVVDYLNKKWAERGSPNAFRAFMEGGGRAWVADHEHPNFEAGKRATRTVYGVEPDLTREGEGPLFYECLRPVIWKVVY